jgi:hypothetical protein
MSSDGSGEDGVGDIYVILGLFGGKTRRVVRSKLCENGADVETGETVCLRIRSECQSRQKVCKN